jgi:hypothetical protein
MLEVNSTVKVVNLLDRKWSGVPTLVLIIGSVAGWLSLARDDPQSHMPVDENRILQGLGFFVKVGLWALCGPFCFYTRDEEKFTRIFPSLSFLF